MNAIVTTHSGQSEQVTLRRLPIRDFPKFLDLSGDLSGEIAALVEFVCDKPAGWADTLTDDSLFSIHERIQTDHAPRVGRWAASLREANQNLAHLLGAQLANLGKTAPPAA